MILNCLVWVPHETVFQIQIARDETVGILKSKAKEENPAHFQDVNVGDIQLLKLKVSRPPKDVGDVDVHNADRLNDPLEVISGLFESPLPTHLHVIVLPPDVPRKHADSLTVAEVLSYFLLKFFHLLSWALKRPRQKDPYLQAIYNILWKGEGPDHVQPFNPFRKVPADTLEDASAKDGDIEILDFSPLPNLEALSQETGGHHHTRLLVRRAYHEFRQYVQDVVQKANGRRLYIMLCGHPGIGKTSLLFVMLCWCLQTRTPVYYQTTDGLIWFFNEDGCEALEDLDFPRHRKRQPDVVHYYLFDLNDTQSLSRVKVVRCTVLIVASSPSTNYYKRWAKRIGDLGTLTTWWLEPYTKEEIMDYAKIQGYNLERIERAYKRFGGSARLCFNMNLKLDDLEAQQDREIAEVMTSPARLIGAIAESPSGPRDEWTSIITAIVPKVMHGEVNRHSAIVQIVSDYVGAQLALKARKTLVMILFDHFDALCQGGSSRSLAGSMFEELGHRTLRKGLAGAELQGLSTSGRVTVALGVNDDQFFDSGDLNITQNTYLRPTSRWFPGIDSLLLDQGGVLNLFQITINTSHGVNGVFWDDIPQAYQTNLRLIFVMPVEEASMMQRQVIHGRNINQVKRIPQFVLALTRAQVEAAIDEL